MYRAQKQPEKFDLSFEFLVWQSVTVRGLDEQEGGLIEEWDSELEEGPVDEEEGVEERKVGPVVGEDALETFWG